MQAGGIVPGRERTGGTPMGIIAWIVLGLIAGAVAKFIMPGKGPGGWIATIILGVVGALVGGFIGAHLLKAGDVGFSVEGIITAILGSLLVLFVYDRFLKR